ncbi:MAG: GyrI-like domain-containing protein [Sphaerochaetaceae bacterium]|nr:GyrI-like domain-containing protein [Sphaerochaetaceae bacterium]MDD3669762.1 GyrI-like domain-containing protein [Sphaerochaetaceae bacterium]NLO59686.1 transcriptional regulator [Spirochaetales bacterium]
MAPFDFKKEYKELYLPKGTPSIISIPEMRFIMVQGKGNPNTSDYYKEAVELLYGISYSIKMSKKKEAPAGYFDYVVPPLEGLWWFENNFFDGSVMNRKDEFSWMMMIRQPDFVTSQVFEMAKKNLKRKKPEIDTSIVKLETFNEGLCAQVMHIGPYDDEPATVALLEAFIDSQGYRTLMSGMRQHHEIYLSDPRKSDLAKLKTVLRHPIEKKCS